MADVLKTLVLKLIEPTANKERKLQETYDAYQRALRAAFTADCQTMSEVHIVMKQFDLSSYAKSALQQFVPRLCGESYRANELHGSHAVRFVNKGVRIDHQPDNHYEWYVKIPHHEDYQLWFPVGLNPAQEPWLHAIREGRAKMGESRLVRSEESWFLHLIARRDELPSEDLGERTPIGIDLGDAALATVCHRDESDAPVEPRIFSTEGSRVRALRKTYFTTTRRLHERGSERIVSEFSETIWSKINDIIHGVSREIIDHASEIEAPVLVLEDLSNIQEDMNYGRFMNRRLHGWAFGKLSRQIRYKAAEAGIPVMAVDPRNTSKECHACGEIGTRPQQATFRCTNKECWISEYQADLNAAVNYPTLLAHG